LKFCKCRASPILSISRSVESVQRGYGRGAGLPGTLEVYMQKEGTVVLTLRQLQRWSSSYKRSFRIVLISALAIGCACEAPQGPGSGPGNDGATELKDGSYPLSDIDTGPEGLTEEQADAIAAVSYDIPQDLSDIVYEGTPLFPSGSNSRAIVLAEKACRNA